MPINENMYIFTQPITKVKLEKEYIRDGRAPLPKDEKTSKVMSAIKAKNTKPELLLRKELWKHNIKGYRLHPKRIHGKPDIAFVGRKVAIFVNGCFWHRCPHCNPSMPKSNTDFWMQKFNANIERDKKKNFLLMEQGWSILTIWECQINKNLQGQIMRIKRLINE